MTLLELQIIVQSISALGIAGGLIYTAIQFKRWRQAAHVANFTKLVELQMQLRKMRVDDPSLAHIYKHDVQDLHSEREIREHFMNLMQLSVYEIVWFSYQQGQIPRDYYESWETRMRAIASEDSFRKMITGPAMKILHDSFQAYMLELVRQEAGKPQ
ncbi:MAG TPA: hypothetical protein VG797_06125 [Phycisphaerales bacterium]|nr:hypothetical protein [Phycisphaerales bacterium]